MKRKKAAKIIWIAVAGTLLLAAGLFAFHFIGLKTELTVGFGEPLPPAETVGKSGDRYAEDYGLLPVGDHVIRIIHNGIPTPIRVHVCVTELNTDLTVEYGESLPPAETIGKSGDEYAEDYGILPVGDHEIQIVRNGVSASIRLHVRDTVAPTAKPRELTLAYGETVTPDKLVLNIRDAGIVGVTFSESFDFDRIGDFDAEITLEDASGNRSTVVSKVHIRAVKDEIALEAGAPLPDEDAFLLEGVQAELQTELTEDMMHHVGTYPVRFLLKNGQTAETTLTVSDTVAPTGFGTALRISPDEPLLPEMLVDRAFDETTLTYEFVVAPDATLKRAQEVTVRMTDEGGNTVEVVSTVAITRFEPITVEASKDPLSPEALGDGDIALAEPFVPDTPGIYSLDVTVDGKPDYVLLTVVDTTPPTVEKRGRAALYANHHAKAEELFSASDLSPVTVEWAEEPDWTLPGEQTVRVAAEDRFGNKTIYEDTITLKKDDKPPVLYGVVNRTAYVGEAIAYFAEVYAEDDVDGRVEVKVESTVQPDRAGTYEVVYTASDLSGNTVREKCKFKLVSTTVSDEEVRGYARDVIAKITTDDMVKAEKLKAVFDYVRSHVKYVNSSDKSDWRKEAVRGFRTGKGDCFTFYSVTRALLDEIDVEYMSLTRLGGRTRHYWLIVNLGTGWYHFDTTLASHHKHKCFMWTNAQCQVKPYFWRYDHSKYPEIATEKFDYDKVVQMEKDGLLP